jgi:hypothetical protein
VGEEETKVRQPQQDERSIVHNQRHPTKEAPTSLSFLKRKHSELSMPKVPSQEDA